MAVAKSKGADPGAFPHTLSSDLHLRGLVILFVKYGYP
jgi:hypothetical protein